MHPTVINSLSEYVLKVCELKDKAQAQTDIWEREELLFRGQSSESFSLIPSLARGRHSVEKERNMIEMAKYTMPEVFRTSMDPIELLARLQHHGVPTRLLDVTENALVALYFACSSNPEKDGEVIVFSNNAYDITNYPVANAIADSYRFSKGSQYSLSLFYGAVKSQPYFLEQKQMNEICNPTNEAGGKWIQECCKKPRFIHAPVHSARQRAQSGRYILFPNHIMTLKNGTAPYFIQEIDALSKNDDCIAGRFLIKSARKKEMLTNLKLFGISREQLFCDSIDVTCEEISKMF